MHKIIIQSINQLCIQKLLILCCVHSDIINLESGTILQFFPYAEAFSPSGTVVTPDAVDVASVWDEKIFDKMTY
ncbi:hypothetical protein V1478_005236 [Vespula squamosa]|uniref:Uncharacterized protein n=1 Tax=Vespula squamosa TaxID=30214 RepID=A0ABD2BDK1_VESSQ